MISPDVKIGDVYWTWVPSGHNIRSGHSDPSTPRRAIVQEIMSDLIRTGLYDIPSIEICCRPSELYLTEEEAWIGWHYATKRRIEEYQYYINGLKSELADKQEAISAWASKYDHHSSSYYSVIQYCPDRFRQERINVGLALISDAQTQVKMINDYKRLKMVFDLSEDAISSLQFMLDGVESFIRSIHGVYAFEVYATTRANDIWITPPRFTKENFTTLYKELVCYG